MTGLAPQWPSVPTIETERLTLRGYRAEDFSLFLRLWSDPAVVRHISGKPEAAPQIWKRFLRMVGHWSVLGFGYWMVDDKATGAPVGEVGFGEFRRDLEPSNFGSPEIGWMIAPEAQGRGYASEAAAAAIGWGDAIFEATRMSCIIAPANAPSLAVARKIGFGTARKGVFGGEEEVVVLFRDIPGRRSD